MGEEGFLSVLTENFAASETQRDLLLSLFRVNKGLAMEMAEDRASVQVLRHILESHATSSGPPTAQLEGSSPLPRPSDGGGRQSVSGGGVAGAPTIPSLGHGILPPLAATVLFALCVVGLLWLLQRRLSGRGRGSGSAGKAGDCAAPSREELVRLAEERNAADTRARLARRNASKVRREEKAAAEQQAIREAQAEAEARRRARIDAQRRRKVHTRLGPPPPPLPSPPFPSSLGVELVSGDGHRGRSRRSGDTRTRSRRWYPHSVACMQLAARAL
jgi:hypothetical protein